jgi:hypothetical protein
VWDVLPVVYASELDRDEDIAMPVVSNTGTRGAARSRWSRDVDRIHVDGRPGLGLLSARAGEALGSYVAPATAPAAPRELHDRPVGAVLRPPTAAQELVQTGRSSGRYGGGEVEIPSWFESAARKMFDSQQSSVSEGISIAELTLIQNAPAHQIAASTRTAASPVAPSIGSSTDSKGGQKVDIEKLANEIYRQILTMMDAARARNGEPYL